MDLYELHLFARSIRVPEAGDSDGDDMTKRIYHAILSARKFLVDLQPKALEEC